MKEETNKILEKLDNTDEIKKIKELNKKINSNQEYLLLMKDFEENKKKYIENNTYNDELIALRKKLFSIDELKEYLQLQNELRLIFTKVNDIIFSIIE